MLVDIVLDDLLDRRINKDTASPLYRSVLAHLGREAERLPPDGAEVPPVCPLAPGDSDLCSDQGAPARRRV